MPLAERNGVITEIDKRGYKNRYFQLADWKSRKETENLGLSININVQQFSMPGFDKALEENLNKANICRSLLTL